MAVEAKQVCEYLGIDPEGDWSEEKSKIDEKFIQATPEAVKANKELYSSLLGNVNGAFTTRLRKAAEKMGIELTKEEIEGAESTVDLIDLVAERAQSKIGEYPQKIEEMETELAEAKKKGASAKDIEKLQGELDKWEQKYNDLKGLHDTTSQEFDQYKSQVATEKQDFFINRAKQKARDEVRLKTKSDWERKGFLNDVDSKYKVEADGEDVIVRDKEGNRIKNPDKAGEFMSYADVLKMEAKKAELLDDNPHNGKEVKRTTTPVINAVGDKKDGFQPRKPALRL